MALLAASGLSKYFGTRPLFEDISFEIDRKEKVGLVGTNGCGKTTLLRLLSGEDSPDVGSVYRAKELRLGTMRQSVDAENESLYCFALSAFAPLLQLEHELEALQAQLAVQPDDGLILRQHRLSEYYQSEGGLTFHSRTRSTLMGLGFSEEELEKPMGELSGGMRNKAQLAKLLLSGADLLLLDEPTNHLDLESTVFLEDFLRSYPGGYLVVSHDRYFLDRVTSRTLELKNGRLIATKGNYSNHLELTAQRDELLLRNYHRQQREIRRIEAIVAQQKRWGRAHNFITAASKQKQADRLRAELVTPQRQEASIRFQFQAKEPGGNDVLMADSLLKSYEKPVLSDVSLHLTRGERVFLLGANGSGKTTLLKIFLGLERPDGGSFRLGAGVQPGYYEQHMTSLTVGNTVLTEIHNAYPYMNLTEVRSALAAFLFSGDDVFKEICALSGGEKARVQLLKLMLGGANLLFLDEPTNHLDIRSREALEDALTDYGGTLLIVTHDRYLVNRLADRILYLENGALTEYLGDYDDCLAARATRQSETVLEQRQEKPNAYKEQKARQSAVNRAKGVRDRTEKSITEAEMALANLEAEMAEPEIASNYVKAAELATKAEELRNEIADFYAQWEAAEAALDELLLESNE